MQLQRLKKAQRRIDRLSVPSAAIERVTRSLIKRSVDELPDIQTVIAAHAEDSGSDYTGTSSVHGIDLIGRKRAILKWATMTQRELYSSTELVEWYRLVDGEELRYWRIRKASGVAFNAHQEFRLANLERIAKEWCDVRRPPNRALPFDDTCPD